MNQHPHVIGSLSGTGQIKVVLSVLSAINY